MATNPWGAEIDETNRGLFAIGKSLDGEQSTEYVDKEQLIGIKIADEEFLLAITLVNEIIMLPRITFVPNGPKFVEGVINLRGTILPVINLRKIMNLPRGAASSTTRIVICLDETTKVKVGILVDAITFVSAIAPDEISHQPMSGGSTEGDIISGICKSGSIVRGILDFAKILHIASGGLTLEEDTESDLPTAS